MKLFSYIYNSLYEFEDHEVYHKRNHRNLLEHMWLSFLSSSELTPVRKYKFEFCFYLSNNKMSIFEYAKQYCGTSDEDNRNINLSPSMLDHFHRSHTSEEYKAMIHELFHVFGLQYCGTNNEDNRNINLSPSMLDHFHRSHTSEEYNAMIHELFHVFGLQYSRTNNTKERRFK